MHMNKYELATVETYKNTIIIYLDRQSNGNVKTVCNIRVASKIEVSDWQLKVMVPWSPYGLLLTGGSRRCTRA